LHLVSTLTKLGSDFFGQPRLILDEKNFRTFGSSAYGQTHLLAACPAEMTAVRMSQPTRTELCRLLKVTLRYFHSIWNLDADNKFLFSLT
jgi:hypothetical protein